MAILEGRWDCSSCGRVANMGHDVHCPGCGKPRGKVQFYLPENAEELADAEKLAEAQAGPDWICAYCDASNRSTNAHCTGCGAGREDGKARPEGGGDETEMSAAQIAAKNAPPPPRRPAARSKALPGILIGLLLFMCCGGFGTLGAFTTRLGGQKGFGGPTFRFGEPKAGAWVTVTGKSATRSIAVEAQKMVTEETWCSAQPADAHELSRRSKQDGTRCQWVDPSRRLPLRAERARCRGEAARLPLAALGVFGTKNLNNGYFESSKDPARSSGNGGNSNSCRNIPVYRDWCSWEAIRWTKVRVPERSSTDAVPEWPSVMLAPGEREGPRTEEYLYDVNTSDGETVHMTSSQSEWLGLHSGEKRSATFSMFGGLKAVGGLL